MSLDLLAIGPHPDDVELFCGGVIIRAVEQGRSVGILDLTRGEAATRGTPEQRAEEARDAARILGVAVRENLGLPDLGLGGTRPDQIDAVASAIRRLRPAVVLGPPPRARHPDHEAGSAMVRAAVFKANVAGWRSDAPRHRVERLGAYVMRFALTPSLIVDTSGTRARKRRAIEAYASQFGSDGLQTLLSSAGAIEAVEARDAYMGAQIGAETGEPLLFDGVFGASDLFSALEVLRGSGFFWEAGTP